MKISVPSSWRLVLPVALWLATVGNLPLWQRLVSLGESGTQAAGLVLTLALPVLGAVAALLFLLNWPRVFRPLASVLVVVSAFNSHFMWQYSAVIDPTMMANVVNTDVREVRDLLSWALPLTVLGIAGPPLWWLWRRPQPVQGWWPRLGGNALGLVLGLVLALVSVLGGYQQLASLARNHKPVRYMINPLNSVYAMARLGAEQLPRQAMALESVGEDAALLAKGEGPAPLFVVVVGETARAQNWGLNGYARNTTPAMARWQAQGDLVNFPHVSSCGTNTQVSVPCMFSPLTREQGGDKAPTQENLLDVLQRAGLAVLWLDNQSGCKGVCARVPNDRPTPDPALCEGDECFDEALLRGLDERLAALDPERRARGTVLVLHLMGSHGPAYYKRTPADRKHFLPECTSNTLSQCAPDALVNTYDNTIAYTDHVLDSTLQWLQKRAASGQASTGLIFMSDHGESLGENGLYLHGVPYAFAPEQQTRVPMVAWFSPALQQRNKLHMDCLRQRASQPYSHDNLFHTVLGVMGVQTRAYEAGLDALAPCVR